MKFKLPVALMLWLLAATVCIAAARYTIVTDTNNVATVSFTNDFFEGVCTVEGRDGRRWVPLQNFFTTQRMGQVQFKLPASYARLRLVALAIGPGNTFTRLPIAYGKIHTVAGGGANPWQEGANATDVSLNDPRFATADEEGNIYVVERGAHAVDKITPDGKIYTVMGTRRPGYMVDPPGGVYGTNYPLRSPSALYYSQKTLFVLDAGNSRIVMMTNNVVSLLQYDYAPTPGVETNSAGLWVSDDLLEAFYGSGTVLKRLDDNVIDVEATGFFNISHVTVDPRGRTIVCDSVDNRVYRVRGNGQKEVVAGNGFFKTIGIDRDAEDVGLPGASSVAYLPIGGYLVSLDSGARVWCVDADDQASPLVFGAPGVRAGDGKWFRAGGRKPKISNALNVSIAPNGDIIILEREGTIRKIDFLRHRP
jgi:hypothetical protein